MSPPVHRFGRFELDTADRRLRADGEAIAVGPRALDLLAALVDRAGRLVSKNELLDRVWPNLVVEENNLQVQISALRKILGPRAIATIPGHGYRFTAELIGDAVAPAAPPAAAAHNLPQQLTSFVGRARELAEVRALLRRTRLLTLVGFGGIGKTRLALQVVADEAGDYPDGVWLIELAALHDATMVPQAVASVLSVREERGQPVLEALLKHVNGRKLLLVLDSCEHLLHACAEVAKKLLQTGPHVKIFATSRERLNIGGETTYPVRTLALPEAHADTTVDTLSGYDAVQLFVDRARTARAAFRLSARNATAVAAICRRVDGIPLAIELAAARVRALSAEKIAERLSDQFRLLTRGDPTTLPHRQTLRALIDWSYDVLTAPQRAVLGRLAVFPGSFTLEAAEAVAAGDVISEADVLDLLTDLIEKSLVGVDADGERYRLLDTVREYALERLDESGNGNAARTRHLAFYLAFAEEVEPRLRGPEQRVALERLDLEWENFLAAHAFCGRVEGAADQGLRLIVALHEYWLHRARMEVGYRLTLEALQRTPADVRSVAQCMGLCAAAVFEYLLGRYGEAEVHLEEAVSIARGRGDEGHLVVALRLLGVIAYSQCHYSESRRHLEEALVGARRLPLKRQLVGILGALADVYRLEGRLGAAVTLLEEALAVARAHDYLMDAAGILRNLAAVSIGCGSTQRARETLIAALDIVNASGTRLLGQGLVEATAGLAASLGEWRRAAELWGAADAQCERLEVRRQPVNEAYLLPLIAKTREALGASAYAAADAAGRSLSYDAALAEARAWLEQSPGETP